MAQPLDGALQFVSSLAGVAVGALESTTRVIGTLLTFWKQKPSPSPVQAEYLEAFAPARRSEPYLSLIHI